jgi:hypothetical protein
LLIDTLQHILWRATEEGLLSPLRDRAARLCLSLYADDDVVVFVNPEKEDMDMIMSILQRFGDATGLKINVHKSSVAPIRCSQVNLDAVLQSFQGEKVQFPINYLGLPLNLGHLKMSHLQPILDQASGKLAKFSASILDYCCQASETILQSHRQTEETLPVGRQPVASRGEMQSELGYSVSSITLWWLGEY